MRRLAALLLVCAFAAAAPAAYHSCPRGGYPNGIYNGSNTFYIQPSQWELNWRGWDLPEATTALQDQGYDGVLTPSHSYGDTTMYYPETWPPDFSITTVRQYIQNSQNPVRVLVAYQHSRGTPPVLAWELYAYTTQGLSSRNQAFATLSYFYQSEPDGRYSATAEIMKTQRVDTTATENSYYGIGVTPRFFKKIWNDSGIQAPDLMWIIGCNTGNSGWSDLLTEAGVRCLVTMNDSSFVQWETLLPWWRMNGRGWAGYGTSPKRLRTAPLAFTEEEAHEEYTYMRRGDNPLWCVEFAPGVDSMALSPTLFNLTLAQGTTIGRDPVDVYATFSCPMWDDSTHGAANIRSRYGVQAQNAHWIDPVTLKFQVRSVRISNAAEVTLLGKDYDWRHFASQDGYHDICFSGHGPVGPARYDSTIVLNTTYEDPTWAAAYDGVTAWRDSASATIRVWFQGTEAGSVRHVIQGGPSPDDLHELASVAASGVRAFWRDELVTVPSAPNVKFVRVVEEPDQSATRIADVLPAEPPEHKGYLHHSHGQPFISTAPPAKVSVDVASGPAPTDGHVVLFGPQALLDCFRSHDGESVIKDYASSGQLIYVPATRHDGWELVDFLDGYRRRTGNLPKGAFIIGDGADDESAPRNDISPYRMACDQEDCFFSTWQSGDATWGVDEGFFSGRSWIPLVPIGRVPAHTPEELRNYLVNAHAYVQMADARKLSDRAIMHLGDQWDGGVAPDSVVALYSREVVPFMRDRGFVLHGQLDSEYDETCTDYGRSHTDFAQRLNDDALWPSIWLQLGVTSNSHATPGYIVHRNVSCNSWDGSLLQTGKQHPMIVFGAGCGAAGIFREKQPMPSLAKMFLTGAADKPSAVAWVGASSGGKQTYHMAWWRLWMWAWKRTTNVFDAYALSLRMFAALYPGQVEYAAGMEYLGLPLPWPLPSGVRDVGEVRTPVPLLTVRPNPVGKAPATIEYELPPSPLGARVECTLYDVAGRQVRRIEDRRGTGRLEWDGRSDQGRMVASGVYFLALSVNGVPVHTTRLIVAR